MDIIISDQIKPINDSLSEMERILRKNLNPIAPRGKYIHILRQRLYNEFPKIREPHINQGALLAIGSILSGIILLILGIRTVITLISALGLLNQYRRHIEGRQVSKLETI
jgi:hypothetical protein